MLLLGAEALRADGLLAARRVAERVGGRLLMETYPALVELGGELPPLERLAYFPQDVLTQLGEATVVLVGARAPVSYFGYEGQPSELVPAAGSRSCPNLQRTACSRSRPWHPCCLWRPRQRRRHCPTCLPLVPGSHPLRWPRH